MHEVNMLLSPAAEVPHKPVEVVSLRHINRAVSVELLELVHQHEGHVLVVDVEDQVWSRLVDASGEVRLGKLYNLLC